MRFPNLRQPVLTVLMATLTVNLSFSKAYITLPENNPLPSQNTSVYHSVSIFSPKNSDYIFSPNENLTKKTSEDYKNWYETLPDFNAASNRLVDKEEVQAGQYLLRMIRGTLPVITDPWIQAQTESMVNGLTQKAEMQPITSLAIIRDPQINAFAAPGGAMGINSGLFLQMTSPDQVAAVVAHELSHLKQRHFERRQQDLKNLQWMTIAAMLAGLALTQSNGNVAGAVLTGAQAYNASKTLSYSREAEKEADRMGMQILRSAGYSPAAMAQTFEIMDKKSSISAYIPGFLLTHPLTQDRVTEARLIEQNLPPLTTHKILDEEGFRLLQDRLRVLSGEVDDISLKGQDINDPFIRLQLAQVQINQGKLSDAENSLKIVSSQKPAWDLPKYLLFKTALLQKKLPEAKEIINALYRLTPENHLYRLMQAEYYIANNQSNLAIPALEKLSEQTPASLSVWQLLAQAYSTQPKDSLTAAKTSYARAEQLFWQGQLMPARIQLQNAIRLAGQNDILKSRYEARLQEIDDMQKRFSKKYGN